MTETATTATAVRRLRVDRRDKQVRRGIVVTVRLKGVADAGADSTSC